MQDTALLLANFVAPLIFKQSRPRKSDIFCSRNHVQINCSKKRDRQPDRQVTVFGLPRAAKRTSMLLSDSLTSDGISIEGLCRFRISLEWPTVRRAIVALASATRMPRRAKNSLYSWGMTPVYSSFLKSSSLNDDSWSKTLRSFTAFGSLRYKSNARYRVSTAFGQRAEKSLREVNYFSSRENSHISGRRESRKVSSHSLLIISKV